MITNNDIATYAVCPESWRLRKEHTAKEVFKKPSEEIKAQKNQWFAKQNLLFKLYKYRRVSSAMLIGIVAFVFFIEYEKFNFKPSSPQLTSLRNDFAGIPFEILSLILILGLIIFIWDLFDRKKTIILKDIGLKDNSRPINLKYSNKLSPKNFYSEKRQLLAKPDGVIEENKFLIPVLLKPGAKKVQDRHVLELLLNLSLIKEINNQEPPYGLLVIHNSQKSIKIKNTPEKQRWLESILDEMHSIEKGVPAIATPNIYKCKGCDVRQYCSFSAYRSDNGSSENISPLNSDNFEVIDEETEKP